MNLTHNLKYRLLRLGRDPHILWRDLVRATTRHARQTTSRHYLQTVLQHLIQEHPHSRSFGESSIESTVDLTSALVRQYADLKGSGQRPLPGHQRPYGHGEALLRALQTNHIRVYSTLDQIIPDAPLPGKFYDFFNGSCNTPISLDHPIHYNYASGDRFLRQVNGRGQWEMPPYYVLSGIDSKESLFLQRYIILRMLASDATYLAMGRSGSDELRQLIFSYRSLLTGEESFDTCFATVRVIEIDDFLRCALLIGLLPEAIGMVARWMGCSISVARIEDYRYRMRYFTDNNEWVPGCREGPPGSLIEFLRHQDRYDPVHRYRSR